VKILIERVKIVLCILNKSKITVYNFHKIDTRTYPITSLYTP